MSNPGDAHVLTADRLEELRLISIGADRRADGTPFIPNRMRLNWLRDHGYLEIAKVPAGSGAADRKTARVVTSKAREVLAGELELAGGARRFR